MGSEEVRLFLSSLANSRHVAINTQKIALNALAFVQQVFTTAVKDIDYIPASKPRRLPSVISANEVQRIFAGYEYSQPSYFYAAVWCRFAH